MRNAHIPEAAAEKATAVRATVAHNLAAELKAQRWSQRAAATALGLTPRYVNSRAVGDVDMSASDLAMFAEFLNIPIARFFDETHEHNGNVTSINAKKAPTRKGGSHTEPPARLELATCSLQGDPSPVIHMHEWRKAS